MSFEALGGLAKQLPNLAGYFLLVTFAVMGLPGLNSFVAEFLILLELFKSHWVLALLASTALIWGAIYMLGLVRQIFWGAPVSETRLLKDLSMHEHMVLVPLVILVFWLGIYPKFFIDGLNQNQQSLQAFKNPPVVKAIVVQKGRTLR
jgi:NADH-quinone oxidoreductase subunit M